MIDASHAICLLIGFLGGCLLVFACTRTPPVQYAGGEVVRRLDVPTAYRKRGTYLGRDNN